MRFPYYSPSQVSKDVFDSMESGEDAEVAAIAQKYEEKYVSDYSVAIFNYIHRLAELKPIYAKHATPSICLQGPKKPKRIREEVRTLFYRTHY